MRIPSYGKRKGVQSGDIQTWNSVCTEQTKSSLSSKESGKQYLELKFGERKNINKRRSMSRGPEVSGRDPTFYLGTLLVLYIYWYD